MKERKRRKREKNEKKRSLSATVVVPTVHSPFSQQPTPQITLPLTHKGEREREREKSNVCEL